MAFCANCGSVISDNERFCGNCGQPTGSSSFQSPSVETTDSADSVKTGKIEKKGHSGALIFLLIVGLTVAFVVGAVMVGNSSSAAKTPVYDSLTVQQQAVVDSLLEHRSTWEYNSPSDLPFGAQAIDLQNINGTWYLMSRTRNLTTVNGMNNSSSLMVFGDLGYTYSVYDLNTFSSQDDVSVNISEAGVSWDDDYSTTEAKETLAELVSNYSF